MDCFGTYLTHVETCNVTVHTGSIDIEGTHSKQCQQQKRRTPQCCDHEVLSSMAMEVWKCLMPWLVQDHSKHVPKLDLTKARRKCSRYHSETKNTSKNEPHFEGPKNMNMLRFPANNNVLVPFFSAHWNCGEFREFLKLQCYKTMRICTFFCCQQMFFL